MLVSASRPGAIAAAPPGAVGVVRSLPSSMCAYYTFSCLVHTYSHYIYQHTCLISVGDAHASASGGDCFFDGVPVTSDESMSTFDHSHVIIICKYAPNVIPYKI